MCMGIFTCPRCGTENNQSFLRNYTIIDDFSLSNMYIGLNPPTNSGEPI
jgi:hypothetical protein